MQVTADVLDVFSFLRVDVAWQVEIKIVLFDLVAWHEPRVAGVLFGIGKDVDDLVDVTFAQPGSCCRLS